MPFIKSHSNYVLKSKHQDVNDGIIYERDITTIGGVDQFSPGQTPIYRSNNFIITVRNDGRQSNQYNTSKWKENDYGETWTLKTINDMVSSIEDDNDTKIVLKQDYYDFRDFAYYGSLTELFRASVTDIISRFPGELFVTSYNAYYTTRENYDFDVIEEQILLGGENYYLISNPLGIDIHSVHVPNGADTLKYFAEDGFLNYFITSGETNGDKDECGEEEPEYEWSKITGWTVEIKDPCDTCSCTNFTIDTSKMTFNENGGTIYRQFTKENCLSGSSVVVSSNPSWATARIQGNELVVSVGNTNNARKGEIVVTASIGVTRCKAKIAIEQTAPRCSCNDNFKVSVDETEFGRDGGTTRFSFNDNCVDKETISATSNKDWVTINGNTITVASCGEGQYGEDSATITFNGKLRNRTSCTTSTTITRHCGEEPLPDCDCGDLEITLVNNSTNMRGLSIMRSDEVETQTESYEELYRRFAEITLATEKYGSIKIYGYLDDKDNVIYLVKGEQLKGFRIRPDSKFFDKFYNECDNFEKLLVNKNNGYKATFSVIRENKDGYYREFVPFRFPTSYGGYNLDASDEGFNEYTAKMSEIGEYYDENFTDNIWRSMTHEAIKNFDWSYTREYTEGDEEEYVVGGERIQKALRIFGREFDEIISYINAIKSINRITYDERNNLPDYFLTDAVSDSGWDVKLVYPYHLSEYYYNDNGEKILCEDSGNTKWTEGGIGDEKCNGQLNNRVKSGDTVLDIEREFSQNANNKVKPYTKWMIEDGSRDGYFIVCNDCTDNDENITRSAEKLGYELDHCGYDGSNLSFIPTSCKTTYSDACALSGKGVLKNRIKSYTDEDEWSYQEVNNEFLRRLKINSPYIWRHKGTIDGIEMVLGMFGMKSKRWIESQPKALKECKYGDSWDYEITEYSSFANRIEETWDVIHQDYRINWINTTKSITYDNRFVSNYNTYGTSSESMPYQGILVAYREAYISQEGDDAYLGYLSSSTATEETKYRNIRNEKIIKRYLYPYFDKNEELDGGIYFQMNGGWASKSIIGGLSGETTWNFQYNVDDKIVFNKYLERGYHDSGFTFDNIPLHTETIRNIKRVDNISSLLAIPTMNLYNGIICYVSQIEKNSAVVDNVVYPIVREWNRTNTTTGDSEGNVVSYISLLKTDGFIKVGSNKFFDTTIIVYGVNGEERIYNVEEIPNGNSIKAYILEDNEIPFICKEDEDGNYSISNFQMLDTEYGDDFTNYFLLDDVNYSDTLAKYETSSQEEQPLTGLTGTWTSGWRRLTYEDKEYLQVSTIINYYKGNNPHNGNMIYDNGHLYFEYFNRIFKHAADNDLFDERCYEDYYTTLDNEITLYGFMGLIESEEDILQYDDFLIEDSKIHYFGNYKVKENINNQKIKWTVENAKSNGVPNIDTVWVYGDDTYKISGTPIDTNSGRGGYDLIYLTETNNVNRYNLSANTTSGWVEEINPYNELSSKTETIITDDDDEVTIPRYPIIDDVTKQIVNNKVIDITFKLHNIWYSKAGQEELKYIDSIVMNYFTQMIPSTAILRIKYDSKDVETSPEQESNEDTITVDEQR